MNNGCAELSRVDDTNRGVVENAEGFDAPDACHPERSAAE